VQADGTVNVDFTLTVTNSGNVDLTDLTLVDDMTDSAQFGGAFQSIVSAPVVSLTNTSGASVAPTANGAFDGGLTDDGLLIGTDGILVPGDSYEVQFSVNLDGLDPAAPATLQNQAEAGGASPTGADVSDLSDNDTSGTGTDGIDNSPGGTGDETGDDNPTVITLPDFALPDDGALVVTKSVDGDTSVVLGDTVSYTITATNSDIAVAAGPLNVVDVLPVGLTFIPGSATVDGVATTPVVNGQTIVFPGQVLAPVTTTTYTLTVSVGANAPSGELTNTVALRDPATNALLSNIARAAVFRRAEDVFDCSHVIGKVFVDRNFDGYQNDPDVRTGEVTDFNAPYSGKIGSDSFDEGEEEGLANVRVVTPTGTVITTDEFGRYHVPCAEIPTRTGANFSLKLDTRSLPTGYRVTTENPRVMRLTPGIMTELNFGVALGEVIDIDLTAAAFDKNGPVDRLEEGIARILSEMERKPTFLRLSYFKTNEDKRLIRRRLDAVEDFIRERWRGGGRNRLIIERNTIVIQ
jgi:uncharacterized repeat protein (TIGR01451 family)